MREMVNNIHAYCVSGAGALLDVLDSSGPGTDNSNHLPLQRRRILGTAQSSSQSISSRRLQQPVIFVANSAACQNCRSGYRAE